MRCITLNAKNISQVIAEALIVLRRGGVVAYPTETSYGLGVDATNQNAIEKVFAIKGRDRTKMLSVLVAHRTMAGKYAKFSQDALRLWDAFLPGPLTLVIPGRWGGTLGVRLSSHPLALRLVRALREPLTATSANRSGHPALRDPEAVIEEFSRFQLQPDLVIDAGILPKRRPSTVVDCTGNSVRLLRKGSISFAAITKVLQS